LQDSEDEATGTKTVIKISPKDELRTFAYREKEALILISPKKN